MAQTIRRRGQKSWKKLEKVGYSNGIHLIGLPMNIPQMLQSVDETVCAKTGKHLNDLQRRIIAGILNRQKYAGVAETYGYSDKHVKKVSHELLQMLSDVFGEQVKKSIVILNKNETLSCTISANNLIKRCGRMRIHSSSL